MTTTPTTVPVELPTQPYDIRIGPGLLGELASAVDRAGGASRVAVIADSTVAALYGQAALQAVSADDTPAALVQFPAGEENKNFRTYAQLTDALLALEPAVDRSALIVALGGGVTGDLAGFVAATLLRGVRFIQCPTTLLAAVDASVGGKTGIDHPAGKNLIGAFHQPRGVWIDVSTLATLPDEQLRSGLAECVKHGVIRDEKLLDEIERSADELLDCEPEAMTDLIARNVRIKAQVVAEDERESGVRAHLNFGHTVGHAIEMLAGYGQMTHGQAVALGMVAENRMAVRRGLLDEADAERVERILDRLGLAVRWQGAGAEQIWQAMQHDKKARGGKVRTVLPTALGEVDIYDDTTPQEVTEAVDYLASGA